MYKEVVFGPPGTGKTTHLMTLLENALADTPAEKIAFVSFTRQGTYEGVQRAIEKFGLAGKQRRYFKTIHALCFSALKLKKSMVVQKQHYKLLSDKTGIPFTGYYSQDFNSTNDVYLHCLSMRRHNKKLAMKMSARLNREKLRYIREQYDGMKRQLGKIDYDDMLLNYINDGVSLDVDIAFIDEAQDLTPLQWRVVEKLFAKAHTIYVAGDDDQAVYEWSGADVNKFLNFSKNHCVLKQSYRMPKNVLRIANNISETIAVRKDKQFKPRDFSGCISSVDDITKINFNGGELVLARTNWLLKKLTTEFASLGLPYELKGKLSYDKFMLKAIAEHDSFEKGERKIKDMMKYKAFFGEISMSPWQTKVDMPRSAVRHYETLLRKGTDFKPIKFETFHSCKGSENDHVIVFQELSRNVSRKMYRYNDSEMRCLYVAVTRSKKDLTFLTTESKHAYPNRLFV